MKTLGVELMSVFGMPPIPYIELVAELDCRYITAVLEPLAYNPNNYPKYSLRTDAQLRREMMAALRANDVQISLGEGFVVRAGGEGASADPFAPGDGNMRERWAADFDLMAELGIRRVNAVSTDPDLHRSFDQLGIFAELAATRGMESTIEFCPGLGIADLSTALDAVRHVGRTGFRLLLDPMHLIRSGGIVADVAALDPDLIGHAQLCDVPLISKFDSYIDEAMYERLPPGKGELPLLAYLQALPRGMSVGLEVPQRSLAEAGVSPLERVRQAVEGARALIEQLEPV